MNIIGTTILVLPSLLVKEAEQDAWISAIFTLAVSLPLLWLYLKLHRRYPDKTIAQITEIAFGKWAGATISIAILLMYPLLLAALTLRNVGDFLTTQIMQGTPIEAIHIIFIIVVIYAVRLGLEPIVRVGELFILIVLAMLTIMFVTVIPHIKVENLFPILEDGMKPVIRGAIPFIGFPFMENIFFLMIIPYVKDQARVGRSLVTGVIIGWFILFILTILTIVVLGTEITATEMYPSYMLAQKIDIGKLFERIEITIAVAWFITSFFRVCFYFYCVIAGISQMLKLADSRSLTIPLAMIVVVLSIISSPNTSYLMKIDLTIIPYFNSTFGLVIPVLLLVLTAFRKKAGE